MKVLCFFRNLFLVAFVACLLGAAFNQGAYVGDILAAKSLQEASQIVKNPESPEEAINFCLIWAFRMLSALFLFQFIIFLIKLSMERMAWKRTRRNLIMEMPKNRQWWGQGI